MTSKTPGMLRRALSFARKASSLSMPLGAGFTSPTSNHITFVLSNDLDFVMVYCLAHSTQAIWIEAVDDGPPSTSFTTVVNAGAFLKGLSAKGFHDASDTPPSLPSGTMRYLDL